MIEQLHTLSGVSLVESVLARWLIEMWRTQNLLDVRPAERARP